MSLSLHAMLVALSLLPAAAIAASAPATTPAPASAEPDALAANDAEFMAGFDKLYDKTWGEGAIPAKYKELSGVTLSVGIYCERCLAWHIKQAVQHGANKEELVEAMRIGLLSRGSGTIPTIRAGYRTMQELGIS